MYRPNPNRLIILIQKKMKLIQKFYIIKLLLNINKQD